MKYRITYEVENEDGIRDDVLREGARLGATTLQQRFHEHEAEVRLRSIAVETHDWKQLGV
jgi:hypothetical protein